MAEETSSASSLLTRLKGYLKEAPFFCKIIELVKPLIITISIIGASFKNISNLIINNSYILKYIF